MMTFNDLALGLRQDIHYYLRDAVVFEHFTNLQQTGGRVDRGRERPFVQRIFISADYIHDIVRGNDLAGGFERRSNKLAHSIIQSAKLYRKERSPHITDFDQYRLLETAKGACFLECVNQLVRQITASEPNALSLQACRIWSALRNPLALTHPQAYREALLQMDWSGFEHAKQVMIDYLYMPANQYGGNPRFFVETVTEQQVEHESVRIISDCVQHPDARTYDPISKVLHTDLIDSHDGNDYGRLCRDLGFVPAALFGEWLPRPHFLHNFIKGFVGEMLAVEAIRRCGIEVLPNSWAIEHGIFEVFDTYCRLPCGRIVGIDSKHWRLVTAMRHSAELIEKSISKAERVSRAIGGRPLFIYLNTFGGTLRAPKRNAERDIEYFSLFQINEQRGFLTPRFKEIFYAK